MIHAITVYDVFSPKLALEVRNHLALLGIECLEARWMSSFKNITAGKVTQIGTTKDCPPPFGKAGYYWNRGNCYTSVMMLGRLLY